MWNIFQILNSSFDVYFDALLHNHHIQFISLRADVKYAQKFDENTWWHGLNDISDMMWELLGPRLQFSSIFLYPCHFSAVNSACDAPGLSTCLAPLSPWWRLLVSECLHPTSDTSVRSRGMASRAEILHWILN